jgi:hypothetical protein
VFDVTKDADMARRALLHDGSEAYIGDMVRPIKNLRQFEFYRDLEYQIQRRIIESVGLWEGKDCIEYPEIRAADNEMLSQEMHHLFHPVYHPSGFGVPHYEDVTWRRQINPWHWLFARRMFVYCFDHPGAAEDYLKSQDYYINKIMEDNDGGVRDAQPARIEV